MKPIPSAVEEPRLIRVPLTQIVLSGNNPRKEIKGEGWDEFVASVKNVGVVGDIIVRPKGKSDDPRQLYELIVGERRLTAAREAGLKSLLVKVISAKDEEALEIMMVENLHRKDLTPLEEATAVSKMLELTQLSETKLAKRLGKGKTWVAERRRLMGAPDELKKLMAEGSLTIAHMSALMPYVEREELKEDVIKEVKRNAKVLGKSFTETQAERIGKSVLEQKSVNLVLDDYEYEGLEKHFDHTACKKDCPHVLERLGARGMKAEYCLNGECFQDHIKDAREKLNEIEAKKAVVDGVKTGGKYDYDSGQRDLADASFDVKVICKDCPNRTLRMQGCQRFGKAKDEKIDTCMKASCFQGKTAQETRKKKVKCRVELAFVDASFEKYLAKRASPMSAKELVFVLDKVRADTPKKTASLKDLENGLLRKAMDTELESVRYGLNLAHLKQIEPSWPFKVSRDALKEPAKPKKEAK